MANVDNPHGLVYERNLAGPQTPLEEIQLDTNITVAIGDPLTIGSDGYGELAVSGSTTILGVAAEAITGAAATRPKCLYWPALPTVVFSGQVDSGATITFIGEDHDIESASGTGLYEISSANSGKDHCHIIGLKDGSAWSSHAQVLFVFKTNQFSGQS